jgi:hypothetical protein
MTVIDDITALLTPVLHTNTTKDITAAAVRTALISAFTDAVNAIPSTTALATASQQVSRGTVPFVTNLLAARSGQYPGEAGLDWQMATQDNIFPGSEGYSLDKAMSGPTAGLVTSTGSAVTNYLDVTPGGTITISPGVANVAFFDANKVHLAPPGILGGGGAPFASLSVPWDTNSGTVISVPATALFCRVSFSFFRDANRANHRVQVLEGTQTLRHPYYNLQSYVSQHRPWTNKVWSFHGDSIAEPSISGPWAVEAAKYHGAKYAKFETHTGTTVSQLGKVGNGGAVVDLPSTYFDDVDVVFAISGSNDAVAGTTIGAITDATSATTFYGYYKKFIELVIGRKQNIRIVMATIIQRNGLSETTRASYNTAIRAIAAYYGIHLWDIGTYGSQFSPLTFSLYSDDGIHPAFRSWAIIDGSHPTLQKYLGGHLMLGSNLKGLMHMILPVDFVGDPIMTERDDDQIYFIRRVPG